MTNKEKLESRIWTTERCRIGAEERLNFYESIGQIATTWYSILLVVLSVFQNTLRQHFQIVDETSIALSVVVLTSTVAVSGLKFGQRADLFKDSYHDLQRLRADITGATESEVIELEKRYVDALDGSPNHSTWDYKRLVVKRWLENRGKEDFVRHPSWTEVLSFAFRWLIGWTFIVVLIGLPLVILGWMHLVW
jgi:SMODS and SLOG-associating 2TM effector domain family 5